MQLLVFELATFDSKAEKRPFLRNKIYNIGKFDGSDSTANHKQCYFPLNIL
jgi:hypothetical protein